MLAVCSGLFPCWKMNLCSNIKSYLDSFACIFVERKKNRFSNIFPNKSWLILCVVFQIKWLQHHGGASRQQDQKPENCFVFVTLNPNKIHLKKLKGCENFLKHVYNTEHTWFVPVARSDPVHWRDQTRTSSSSCRPEVTCPGSHD